MSTIIDSLLVVLGLDASAFEKAAEKARQTQKEIEGAAVDTNAAIDKQEKKTEAGRQKRTTQQGKEQAELEKKDKDAREKRGKDIEVKAKQAAQGFTKIRNEALGLFAVLAAATGIKAFVGDTITTAAGLERMSAALGVSARDLAMYQLAAKNAGGTAQGMTQQLRDASTELARQNTGGGSEKLMELFKWGAMAGLKIDKDKLKTGTDVLKAQADVLAALDKTDPAKVLVAASAMGVNDDALPLMRQGSAEMERLRQAHAALADEMARAAGPSEAMRKRLDELGNRYEAVKVKVFNGLMPALGALLGQLEKLSAWVDSHQGEINGFVNDFSSAIDKAGYVVGPVLRLIADGWKNIFDWAKAAGEAVNNFMPTSWSSAIGKRIAGVVDWFRKENGSNAAPMAPASAGQPAQANATKSSVMNQLRALGWTQAQAAGITASFMQESNLDPQAVNPTSGARGIGQWLGSRVSDFKKWAGVDLKDSTAKQQIDFFHHEVTNGKEQAAGRKLRATTTAEEAARVHSEAYERPGKNEANNERRVRLANQIHDQVSATNAAAAANMPMGAAAAQDGRGNRSTSTSTTDVKVGQITVNTQATDAVGIAKSIGKAISQHGFMNPANSGLA